MTGAAKMFLVASKQGGNRGGEERGEPRGEYRAEMRRYGGGEMRQHYPMTPYIPPYGNEPEGEMRDEPRGGYDDMESRYQRRYKNGRFAPRSEMEMRSDGGSRRGKERSGNRQPLQIGFRYEEDETRFRSDANYPRMNESEHRTSNVEHGRAESRGYANLDEATAKEWVSKMRGADGNFGGHWSMDQTTQVLKQKNMDCDPVEFYVLLNMLYSDYSQLAKTYGVNSVDFYADMAKSFLDDKDAVDNKLMAYYECVVSH